jgi:hypothetical protein
MGKRLIFCWHLKKRAVSVIQWYGSPDPYQNITNPEHWFRISIIEWEPDLSRSWLIFVWKSRRFSRLGLRKSAELDLIREFNRCIYKTLHFHHFYLSLSI